MGERDPCTAMLGVLRGVCPGRGELLGVPRGPYKLLATSKSAPGFDPREMQAGVSRTRMGALTAQPARGGSSPAVHQGQRQHLVHHTGESDTATTGRTHGATKVCLGSAAGEGSHRPHRCGSLDMHCPAQASPSQDLTRLGCLVHVDTATCALCPQGLVST